MVAHNPPPYGELVRRHRVGAALTQEELAHRAGLSTRGLSDLERGIRRAPRLETVRLLADALGLAGSEREIFVAAARPDAFPMDAVGSDRGQSSASFPSPVTRLIGREEEVAAIVDLVTPGNTRLVTLTGAGGTGKTHLALVVAGRAASLFPGGGVFVDLAPLSDHALVVPTIAAALNVRESPGTAPLDAVRDFLSERRFLLVLDNCEHVLSAASDLAALLATCPGLVVLATSRQPWRIRAEREAAVAPLPHPEADQVLPPSDLANIPSVALFLERASAASADFALTPENAAAVAAICQRLDGLPLALELAAARVRILPPAALLARLEPRLPILTGGGRDLPARQRTMHAAIAWSYDLLTAEDQALFRRLSVFAGGFALRAAETVAEACGGSDIVDGIDSLARQSVVRPIPGQAEEPRYAMLETVREFGLQQLHLSGEMATAREAHAAYFRQQGMQYRHGPFWSMSADGLRRLVPERDNVRQALAWFHERGETEALFELCSLAFGLWFAPGLYQEALQWIERALERADAASPEARVTVLDGAATLAVFQGDLERATRFAAEQLALAQALGDPLLLGRAFSIAGLLAYRRGDYGRASELSEEACRLLRSLVETVPEPILRLGIALLDLGDAALAQEQFARAAARYEEALARFGADHDFWGPIDAQTGLAGVQFCTGNLAQAAVLYADSFDRARGLGATLLVASALVGLAGVAAGGVQPERGARLLGAAEAAAVSLGSPLFPRDQPIFNRCLAAVTAALGADRAAAERAEGRRRGLSAAVGEVLAMGEALTKPRNDEVGPTP